MDPAATGDQTRLMLQSLLKERFKMAAHLVAKEADGYALSIGPKGLKVKEAQPEDPPPPLPGWVRSDSVAAWEGAISATLPAASVVRVIGRRVSMMKLAETLGRVLGKAVSDQTGVVGDYYFAFRFARDDNPAADAPPLAAALRDNLGLVLKKQKVQVRALVVDSMEEQPTEN